MESVSRQSSSRPAFSGQEDRRPPIGLLGALAIAAAALFLVALVLLWGQQNGKPPQVLLRDAAQQMGYWPFTGLVSFLGLLALWAAGAICIFAAFHASAGRALLLLFGAFSILLTFDDLFMLHEYFWPRRGIPTIVSQIGYGLIGLGLLFWFRKEIRGVENVALFLAIALMGFSLTLDFFVEYSIPQLIVEDSAKFAGFLVWSGYWISRASGTLRHGPSGRDALR